MGIQGEVRCIAASPINDYNGFVQISIGTSVAIYTFWFNPQGNNGNGSIGEESIYSDTTKYTIENPCNDYNSIVYSNTESNTFAYFSAGRIHIVNIAWSTNQIIEHTNIECGVANVMGLFRFNQSDRFLTYAVWGTLGTEGISYIMLLDNFRYIVHQSITQSYSTSGYKSTQILINSTDNFMIICGVPYVLSYDIKEKTITYTALSTSNTKVIPFSEELNESLYAVFSKDDKYVYAISEFNSANNMMPLATFKVDYTNSASQWQIVSSSLAVNVNGRIPTFDIVNNKVLCYNPYYHETLSPDMNKSTIGFYYYYADPEIKDVIGLSWNGNLYKKSWTI